MPVSSAPATPAVSGELRDGRYFDDRWPVSIPTPDGWRVRTGRADSALRLTLTHTETNTRVEFWAFSEPSDSPRAREGCRWTFVDSGRYRAVRQTEVLTVATCTPEDPVQPVIFAYLVPRYGAGWQIEVSAPRGSLATSKQLGDDLISGIRW